ncbi:archaea-specific SMC-related protein, partial [Halobellus limi]
MATSEQLTDSAHFSVENVGGIDHTEVDIPPGVTVLTGKNATNRTSFLRSIMAAMGSERVSLKGDAEDGRVELTLDDTTYERTLTRAGDGVTFEGDAYLDDPEVADLFAFLLETNDARQAAARGEQLRDVIMRPVDVDAIRSEIRRLEEEKGDINDELARIESDKRELPELEQRRTQLREKIEEKRAELAELEDEIDDSSRDVEEGRKEQAELEEKLQELRSTRSELESIRRKIERQQESIASLKRERGDLEDDLEELPETPMGDHRDLESEIERLRSERQELNSEINELRSLIQYNEERLEAEDYELLEDGGVATESGDGGGESVTDQLVASDSETVVCWTCGSSVEREQIESTIERLKSLRTEKVEELNGVKSRLEDRKQQQREATKKQRKRSEIEQKLDDIESELDRRDEQIDALKENRESLTDEVEDLESEVESLESADFEEILSLHKEANQLEFEIDSLESDLDEVTEEIESIEADVERADELREERSELV